MSAETTHDKKHGHHPHQEFLVTTFSKKPGNAPSSDILWSEVWHADSPLALSYPFRWVLQKNGEKLRIRDLGKQGASSVSNPIEDIAFEDLGKKGAFEITSADKATYWVLIQPVQELRAMQKAATEGAWSPTIIRPVAVNEVFINRFLKRTAISVAGMMIVCTLALYLMPKKAAPKDELIPEEFAKVLLSPAMKQVAASAKGGGGKGGGSTNVVQAFQSQAVQKTTKSLFSSKAAKALLSGSTLMNTAAASAAARKMFDVKSALNTKSTPGAKNLEVASSGVGMIGGGKGGTGTGTGTGYGIGGGGKVDGQGSGLVDVGSDAAGVSEGLTKNEVGKVIREHMSDIRYCYDSALVRSPGLEGKLVLSFVVKSTGSVTNIAVKEASPENQLDQCIIGRMAKWKFPKPRGGVDVAISYPFIFKTLGN